MAADRLKIILAAFFFLLALGTLGFMAVEDLPPLDAFYMTVITVATVGYGDIVPKTDAGRIFTMVLTVLGVGTTYYSFTYLFSLVVEGQLKNLMGRRGMNRKIASLENHIIVCGAGRVGGNVARHLKHETVDVVVIDNSLETYRLLIEEKITAVHGA